MCSIKTLQTLKSTGSVTTIFKMGVFYSKDSHAVDSRLCSTCNKPLVQLIPLTEQLNANDHYEETGMLEMGNFLLGFTAFICLGNFKQYCLIFYDN